VGYIHDIRWEKIIMAGIKNIVDILRAFAIRDTQLLESINSAGISVPDLEPIPDAVNYSGYGEDCESLSQTIDDLKIIKNSPESTEVVNRAKIRELEDEISNLKRNSLNKIYIDSAGAITSMSFVDGSQATPIG